jgi:hypothetical protein
VGDVSSAIWNYIVSNIRLSQSDVSQAVRSREWFLTRLQNVIGGRKAEPVLYASEPFVKFGSYFKGTKVQAVDEFDILVVIDSKGGVFLKGGQETGVGQGSADPNHKYDDRFLKEDRSGVSPSKLLNWLKGAVKEITDAYGGEAPERNGQAITATIKSKDLKIDLVPAGIFNRKSDGSTFYDIPKGSSDNGWIVTSPRTDVKHLEAVAKDRSNFRNVIRIAKRIKDTYNFLVPSFAVETAVVDYGEANPWYDDLYTDVSRVLQSLAVVFRAGRIPDPYDETENLITGVTSLAWYADRLDKVVETLKECTKETDQKKVVARVEAVFENK